VEPFRFDNVHLASKQILKILPQMDKVKKASPFFQLHQKIHIALWPSLAARHGAEDAHVPRTMLCGDAKDLVSLRFQELINPHGLVP